MKKVLLGTTALLGAGLVASPAFAADGIKLGVGGFFKTAYMVVFDDDSEGEPGNERNTDGVFSDAEIHFTGSTVLDNGLEVGARVELEGEDDDGVTVDFDDESVSDGGDQIDEAWIYFSGGFGELRMGSDDDALANACIVPPGGTGNFSAFSPNQWGANTNTSNTVCSGVDDRGDAQKFVYISPSFAGFQFTGSYTPNGGDETHGDGVGAHLGMPTNADDESRHNFAGYLSYSFEGDGWGLTAGAGAAFEGHVEQAKGGPDRDEQDFYQAGLNLTFGNFSVGGVFEYFNDQLDQGDDNIDTWVAGAGIAYTMDAWTVGLQYSHGDSDNDGSNGGDSTQDRAVITGNYAMGPGINIDAEVAYTWVDVDGGDDANTTFGGQEFDGYDALEIGIGTNITF